MTATSNRIASPANSLPRSTDILPSAMIAASARYAAAQPGCATYSIAKGWTSRPSTAAVHFFGLRYMAVDSILHPQNGSYSVLWRFNTMRAKSFQCSSGTHTVLTFSQAPSGAAPSCTTRKGNAREFKNGRQFAAWIGLTPSQYSTGGEARLGHISKRGDAYPRNPLVPGARSGLNNAGRHPADVAAPIS